MIAVVPESTPEFADAIFLQLLENLKCMNSTLVSSVTSAENFYMHECVLAVLCVSILANSERDVV